MKTQKSLSFSFFFFFKLHLVVCSGEAFQDDVVHAGGERTTCWGSFPLLLSCEPRDRTQDIRSGGKFFYLWAISLAPGWPWVNCNLFVSTSWVLELQVHSPVPSSSGNMETKGIGRMTAGVCLRRYPLHASALVPPFSLPNRVYLLRATWQRSLVEGCGSWAPDSLIYVG